MRVIFALLLTIILPWGHTNAQSTATAEMLVRDAPAVTTFANGITVRRSKHERPERQVFFIDSNGPIPAPRRNRKVFNPDDVLEDAIAKALGFWSMDVRHKVNYRRLVKKGILRPVTESEIQKWERRFTANSAAGAAIKRGGGGIRSPFGDRKGLLRGSKPQSPYMMLTRPIGQDAVIVNYPKRLSIFVPEGMTPEQVPQGASTYYAMSDGRCFGTAGLCAPTWQNTTTANAACFEALPERLYVQGFGVDGPSSARPVPSAAFKKQPNSPLGQIDVYVAPKEDPIFLTLGSRSSAVWALHVAQGAQIAGVLVRGRASQGVSGLPEGVPVRFSTKADGNAPNCGDWASSPAHDADTESWARDVKAITGYGFHGFDSGSHPTHVLMGSWHGIPRARANFMGKPIWDENGEIPALPLDPLTDIDVSSSIEDTTFTVRNPTVFGAIFAVVMGIYILIRRKVLTLIRGEDYVKKRKPAPFIWAYIRGVFAGLITFIGLMMTAVGMGEFASFGISPVTGIMGLILAAILYLPFITLNKTLAMLGVPRGWSDVLSPVLLSMGTFVLLTRLPYMPGIGSGLGIPLTGLGISILSGAAAGWQYWRSLGYPGGDERLTGVGQRVVDGIGGSMQHVMLETVHEFRRSSRAATKESKADVFMSRKGRSRRT